MTQTFTAEATCEPTAAALRDALVGIPNHARVTVTRVTDQRDGDCLTVKATCVLRQRSCRISGFGSDHTVGVWLTRE